MRFQVPQYKLPVPSRCPQCGKVGSIALHQTVKGTSVLLSWGCTECEADWPVSHGEPRFIERRKNHPDRRRTPRPDRRKNS